MFVKQTPWMDAEGDMGSGAAPQATPTPTPQQGQPGMAQNPLLDANFGQQVPAQSPDPVQTPPQMLDFAGRKVPVVDPVIRDIHQDYTNLQRAYQDHSTTMKTLQEQNQMYQQMVQQFQQQQQPPQPQQPQGPTPEQLQEFTQKYMDTFYENPIEAQKMMFESPFMKDVIQRQVESLVNPIVEPIQRERQFTQQVQQLSQKHTDFQEMVPAMKQVLEQFPQLAEQGLETVYLVARGQTAQQQQPQYTPEQMLSDPTFRQKILGDEQFRNEVISTYMQNRTETNQQTPPVIGNQPGGSAPAIPEVKPKTLREGSSLFSRFLGGN